MKKSIIKPTTNGLSITPLPLRYITTKTLKFKLETKTQITANAFQKTNNEELFLLIDC